MPDRVTTNRISSLRPRDPADQPLDWPALWLGWTDLTYPEPEPEQEWISDFRAIFSQSLVGLYQGLDLTLMQVVRGSGLVSCERGTVRIRVVPGAGRRVGATRPVYRSVMVRKPKLDPLYSLVPHGVLIPNPREVCAYLNECPDLGALLPAVCAETRREFGPEVELSLELYRDPEIDDPYLTLYVRQQPYDPNIMRRIERVSQQFNPALETVSGYFLIATDFRRPKGIHAV